MIVRSWKHRLLLLCPAKIMKNCRSGGSNKIKTKLACILEADESTRMRMGNSIPSNHEDHIAGRGENSLQHYNLVHKFVPMPQATKIPASKAAVDKEWEKLEKLSAWNLTKVRSKKEVIEEARTSGATVYFASLLDICQLKNAELEAKHQKYKGRVVLRGVFVKHDSGSCGVITEQGSSASQMTAAKIKDIISRLPGCDGQAADTVSVHTQVKLEDDSKLLKNSQIGVSRHLDSSTTIQMAQIMVQYWRPSRFSWKESVRSSFGRTMMGNAIWESPIETWMGESSKLGMSLCSSWTRIILLCVCGRHKIGWKETKHWSDVETTQQRSRFGRTNIFLWSCILGLHSKTMWSKQKYCRQLQNHVWIANFRGGNRETSILSKYSYFFMVSWHGWSCKEVCGTILWVGKQDYTTTLQSIYSMHRWPPLQRRRNEICWRIVTCMLSNCSEMLILGTNWTTWYSMVSK